MAILAFFQIYDYCMVIQNRFSHLFPGIIKQALDGTA
jgi:hypothetical protein